MAYNTTEAVAKFLSGFQMKITNRERDTVAPDYYVKYSLTLSKGGKDFSTTFERGNGTRRERKGIRRGVRRAVEGRAF